MSKMSVKTAKTFVYSDKLGNDSQALPEEESSSSSDEINASEDWLNTTFRKTKRRKASVFFRDLPRVKHSRLYLF